MTNGRNKNSIWGYLIPIVLIIAALYGAGLYIHNGYQKYLYFSNLGEQMVQDTTNTSPNLSELQNELRLRDSLMAEQKRKDEVIEQLLKNQKTVTDQKPPKKTPPVVAKEEKVTTPVVAPTIPLPSDPSYKIFTMDTLRKYGLENRLQDIQLFQSSEIDVDFPSSKTKPFVDSTDVDPKGYPEIVMQEVQPRKVFKQYQEVIIEDRGKIYLHVLADTSEGATSFRYYESKDDPLKRWFVYFKDDSIEFKGMKGSVRFKDWQTYLVFKIRIKVNPPKDGVNATGAFIGTHKKPSPPKTGNVMPVPGTSPNDDVPWQGQKGGKVNPIPR